MSVAENESSNPQDQPVCSQVSEPMALNHNPDSVIGGVWPTNAVGPYGMCALLSVASGTGSTAVASKASEVCLDAIRERLRTECEKAVGKTVDRGSTEANAASLQDILIEVFGEANGTLIDDADGAQMTSSCTSAMVTGDALIWIHVGNCRLYYYRQGRIQQVTRDDYPAAENEADELEKGSVSNPSELTKSLGEQAEVSPSIGRIVLRPKDVVLVCSDGLWTSVNDNQIRHILMNSSSCEAASEALLDFAKRRGPRDAVSFVLYCHGRWPHGERMSREQRAESPNISSGETVVIKSQVQNPQPAAEHIKVEAVTEPAVEKQAVVDMLPYDEPSGLSIVSWLNSHKVQVSILLILIALLLGILRPGCRAKKPTAVAAPKPVLVVSGDATRGSISFGAETGWRFTYLPDDTVSSWKMIGTKPSYVFRTSASDRVNAVVTGKHSVLIQGPLDGKVVLLPFKKVGSSYKVEAPAPGRYKIYYKAKSTDKGILIGRFSVAR